MRGRCQLGIRIIRSKRRGRKRKHFDTELDWLNDIEEVKKKIDEDQPSMCWTFSLSRRSQTQVKEELEDWMPKEMSVNSNEMALV